MISDQPRLWDDTPRRHAAGEVRRALDRDLAKAHAAGRTFLETEVAAVRRQANDLDRLERIMAASDGDGKPWDYNPKTTAAQAYLVAVRALFGADDDDDDPFLRAVRELDAAAAHPGTTTALDTTGPHTAD